jgi:hypothetical protein
MDAAARRAQSEDADTQGLAGEGFAVAGLLASLELVDDLGIGDAEHETERADVLVGGVAGDGGGLHGDSLLRAP